MLRGTTKFRCPDCGHIFEAPDLEDNATARTMPMPCPRCGAKSDPSNSRTRYAERIVGN